jgi:lipopolysaccharide biosynthesis glycosyltransferase
MKQIHQDWESVLVLVDELPVDDENFAELTSCFDSVVTAAQLGISTTDKHSKVDNGSEEVFRIEDWLYSLTVIEACTAVKPFAFEYLARHNRPIFYLDPDIVVFSSMDEILNLLKNGASIAVTPHLLEPSLDFQAILDNEIGTLRYGMFNFGFLALNPLEVNAMKFIEFWKERLKFFCTEKTDDHLFTDQKWGNFLPSFYDDLAILRHPGMNVANWNLENRKFSFDLDGNCLVNDKLLVFYHFSILYCAFVVLFCFWMCF